MSDEDKKITGELPAAKPVKAEKQNPPILTKEETKEETKEDKAECYVYIGANRLTDGLKCNTVYQGYPKELVKQAGAKYASIARLFVPVEQLEKAREEVRRKGTPLYLAWAEMEKEV